MSDLRLRSRIPRVSASGHPFARLNGTTWEEIAARLRLRLRLFARSRDGSVKDDEANAEQVAALFRAVTWAVLAALAAAIAMVMIFVGLGLTTAARGAAFATFIGAGATAHILLKQAWLRDGTRSSRWKVWGRAFASIAFYEGCGWGWTAYGLLSARDLPAADFCLLVSGGVAVASIPVFAFYLPAFLAFYIPAAVPFIVSFARSVDPLQHATAVPVLIYFVAMMIFGIFSNRSFRRLVDLKMHSDKLAGNLKIQIGIADAANRAKSTFLAAASHDLRQPVHAIGLFVGALRGMPMATEAMQIIEQIEASSQAMDGLFAALLDISSLDAGTVEVDRRIFPIAPMLERICYEHAAEALSKGIVVKLRHTGLWSNTDPVLVERILRNFVSNAVRYTHIGRIVVGCRRRGERVSIEIWDTGPGIPFDHHDHIFQEYYQVGNAERDRDKGLGLGLAIVRRLARLLDCELALRSIVGRGSCFSIAVPLAQRPSLEGTLEHGLPLVLRSLMIVVVDDEADIRRGMTALLEGWGHRVFTAASAQEAVDLLALNPTRPDLIISDFRLRDHTTGIAAIEALRIEYNEDVPAILITGDTAPERLAEARDSGLLLIHKPVSNGRLRAAIANVVGA